MSPEDYTEALVLIAAARATLTQALPAQAGEADV